MTEVKKTFFVHIRDRLPRETDQLQIRHWAEALDMTGKEVLEQLADSWMELESREKGEPVGFAMEDGAIESLVWDFERLPRIRETWQAELLIRAFGFEGEWSEAAALMPCLPRMEALFCQLLGLESLDLSQVPGLTVLDCDECVRLFNAPASHYVSSVGD